jgi:diguanylate cyclase (GGDEF)-like protein
VRILIAEDDPISRRMLSSRLQKWGYEVVATADGNEAWEVMSRPDAPSLAILDWEMPGLDGPEVCRRVRALEREPYVYVLLLTARTRGEDVVAGLEAGADDYVAKPFEANELKVRLRAGRRILDLFEELFRARELLSERATRDSLTRVWNRGAILETLDRERARADRDGRPLAVVMGDIDHFKRVNDQHGHLAGDAVLREVSRRMLGAMRPYDSIGRYGGEEFLVLAPACDLEAGARVAERLRLAVAADPVDTPDGPIPVTASFGVAVHGPGSGGASDRVIALADQALYRAKERGRNRVEAAGRDGTPGASEGEA